jgi:hypothetical protein
VEVKACYFGAFEYLFAIEGRQIVTLPRGCSSVES